MDIDEARRLELNKITERIIGCAYTVGNTLAMDFWKKSTKMRWLMNFAKRGCKLSSNMAFRSIMTEL